MDRLEIEEIIEEIVELRKDIKVIQKKINELVKKVINYMETKDKFKMSIGQYAINYVERTRAKIDYDYLDSLKEKGILQDKHYSKDKYKRLLVTEKDDWEYKDGQFVRT